MQKTQSSACLPPSKGFSLIELMVAVAVVGILAAVAYPAYTSHVVRANRSAASTYLFQLANKEAQYMLDSRSYTSTVSDLMTPPAEVSKYYDISITTGTAPPSFTVSAAPKGSQATRDAACGSLTLDQNGTKGVSGTSSVTDCWR